MCFKQRSYIRNRDRVFDAQDLVGERAAQHAAEDVPHNGGAGKRHEAVSTTASEPIKVAISPFDLIVSTHDGQWEILLFDHSTCNRFRFGRAIRSR